MTKRAQVLDRQIDNLKREIETADRVCFELGNGAEEAYREAWGHLGTFALDKEGISPEKTQEIWALFELYEAKRNGALDAEMRKAAAISALFIALHHPIL